MKKNILFIGFLLVSSFSFSQVSSAKKLPESTEKKEINKETPKTEEVKSEPLPTSRIVPIQINKEQPLIEEKNNTPAQTGRKKL